MDSATGAPRYAARAYAGEADYERMRALLRRIVALEGPRVYCHVGDLDWWRFTEADPQAAVARARLWFAGDELVGFGWPSGAQVDMMVHPQHRALEAEILTWAEGRRRAEVAAGEPAPFSAWCFDHHREREALLSARGYRRGEMHFNANARALAEDPPAPELPPGYRIRHVRGEEDVAARVEVHRDAFAPSRMTVEKHRAVMAAPTYRPELDLVVEAPDGSFAAYCLVWLDDADRMGEFEPVGCHSAHRRLGLTRAVLFEGMRRLRALGADTCTVFSSGAEKYAASRALYASAGFEVLGRIWEWTRELT